MPTDSLYNGTVGTTVHPIYTTTLRILSTERSCRLIRHHSIFFSEKHINVTSKINTATFNGMCEVIAPLESGTCLGKPSQNPDYFP